ncbi:MAG: PAS domain S-box protein [Actinomycetota bacterium]|nr:PAS domain S-box protein [Actinomycetota bacterium]
MTSRSGSTRLGERRPLPDREDWAERRYRELVEHVPAVVYLARPGADGKWLYVSPQIEPLLGFTPEEWSDDPDLWLSRIHEADRRRVIEAEEDFARRAPKARNEHDVPPLRQEYRILARDGRTIWVRDESFVVPAREDEPLLLRGVLLDITEQKRALEALRESEERYRTLFEQVPVGLYRTTPDGRILAANQALATLLGFPDVSSLLEANPGDVYIDPEDRRRWMEVIEREGELRGFEMRHRRRDGAQIWVRDTARAVRGPDGEILYYEGTQEDITERKRWEAALAQSEQRMRAIIKSSMDAIVAMDQEGRIADANPAAEGMFGWPREELIGRPVAELVSTGERDRHVAAVARRAGEPNLSRPSVRLESVAVRRDGREFPVEVTVAELEEASGARFTAFLRDLSERQRAEAAMSESEARFRLIAENAQDIVYRYRVQPDPGYEYVSPAVESLTGYRPEDFYADPEFWVRISHPEEVERITDLFATGRAFTESYRSRWITKDGRAIWCETRNTPIHDADGNMIAFVGITRDVTDQVTSRQTLELSLESLQRSYAERRTLMARLVQAQEQERKKIAGEVHDDSVQAMAAVGLRLDMLKHRLKDEEAVGAVEELRASVNTAVARLRRLMFDLRPPALDRDGLEPALRLHLEEVERAWGLRFELHNRLSHEIPEASRLVLYRIAQEAVANVRKHAEATTVTLTLDTDGGGIRLRVVDDGRGFRVSEHGESPPGHLGLSSMREHAEMVGGKLSIESRAGEGTSVEVWIPEH